MPTFIIALSGPSSSGKTTLARLLQRIFSNQPQTQEGSQLSKLISTFIIHEDDFYYSDDKYAYDPPFHPFKANHDAIYELPAAILTLS
jgi:nicotinamide/nicotinate riboside kinase